jgi:hypothetical protein
VRVRATGAPQRGFYIMIHSNTCSRAALQCLTATGHRLCWWGFLISDVRLRVVVNVVMFFAHTPPESDHSTPGQK